MLAEICGRVAIAPSSATTIAAVLVTARERGGFSWWFNELRAVLLEFGGGVELDEAQVLWGGLV